MNGAIYYVDFRKSRANEPNTENKLQMLVIYEVLLNSIKRNTLHSR